MAFDRNKFRATPLSTVQGAVNQTKQYDTFYGGSSDYAKFFSQRDGTVIKRVLPAKDGESPYVPMMTSMLECEVEEKKDGVVVGKKVQKKKIFLSTLHAGTSKDIIDEYIRRVYALAEQYQDKNERDRFLNPITGYRMGQQWIPGIRPQLEYVFYALIEGIIYRDSLNTKQMETLNRESMEFCAQNDTAAVDIFSDPDMGMPIQWTRSKDPKTNKNTTELKALPLPRTMSWEEYFKKYELTDEWIKANLLKLPSLASLYVKSYKKKDWEYALDGLKRFDEKNGYGIFADDEYLDTIEAIEKELEAFWASNNGGEGESDNGGEDEGTSAPAAPVKKVAPVAKKAIVKKPAGPTTEEKLKVINEEFIAQYGEGYEPLSAEDLGEDLDSTYKLALAHEDLGFELDHVPGWGEPDAVEESAPEEPEAEESAPEEEPEPEAPAPTPVKKPSGIAKPAGTGSASGQSALERIRAMREKQQAEAAKKGEKK